MIPKLQKKTGGSKIKGFRWKPNYHYCFIILHQVMLLRSLEKFWRLFSFCHLTYLYHFVLVWLLSVVLFVLFCGHILAVIGSVKVMLWSCFMLWILHGFVSWVLRTVSMLCSWLSNSCLFCVSPFLWGKQPSIMRVFFLNGHSFQGLYLTAIQSVINFYIAYALRSLI